jgi:hypothetical protein
MGEAEIRIVVRKFDGTLHWHHSMIWLGKTPAAGTFRT